MEEVRSFIEPGEKIGDVSPDSEENTRLGLWHYLNCPDGLFGPELARRFVLLNRHDVSFFCTEMFRLCFNHGIRPLEACEILTRLKETFENFDESLVKAVARLRIVCLVDFEQVKRWQFYCRVLSDVEEVFGDREAVSGFVLNSLLGWIQRDQEVVQENIFGQMLKSSCTETLLSMMGERLFERRPATFQVIVDLIRARVLSDHLPQTVRANYLDSFVHLVEVSQQNRPEACSSNGTNLALVLPDNVGGKNVDTSKMETETSQNGEVATKQECRGTENSQLKVTLLDDDSDLKLKSPEAKDDTKEADYLVQKELEKAELKHHPDLSVASAENGENDIGAHLEFKDGDDCVGQLECLRSKKVYAIEAENTMNLGRSKKRCHVVIDDRNVSRVHAQIGAYGGEVLLQLMSISSYLRVNGQKFSNDMEFFERHGKIALESGDIIGIGTEEFLLLRRDKRKRESPVQLTAEPKTEHLLRPTPLKSDEEFVKGSWMNQLLESTEEDKNNNVQCNEMDFCHIPESPTKKCNFVDNRSNTRFTTRVTVNQLKGSLGATPPKPENRKPFTPGRRFRGNSLAINFLLSHDAKGQLDYRARDMYREQDPHLALGSETKNRASRNVPLAASTPIVQSAQRQKPIAEKPTNVRGSAKRGRKWAKKPSSQTRLHQGVMQENKSFRGKHKAETFSLLPHPSRHTTTTGKGSQNVALEASITAASPSSSSGGSSSDQSVIIEGHSIIKE